LASWREGRPATATAAATTAATGPRGTAAPGCRATAAEAETAARVQRSDSGESARARARSVDEPDLAGDGSGWRHDHVYVECAGRDVHQPEWVQRDVDRAEPGRQLPAHRHGE